MPALASSPARARTVTFMPPESPTPGGASGEECTERTPTRRTGCPKNVSNRAPRVASRSATVTRSTRGLSTRGCSYATGVQWLLLADLAGRGPGRLGVGGGGLADAGAGRLHRGLGGRAAAADPGVGRLGAGDGGAGRLAGLAGRPRTAHPGDQSLAPAHQLAVGQVGHAGDGVQGLLGVLGGWRRHLGMLLPVSYSAGGAGAPSARNER